jgi:hypothetical protein
MKYRRLHPKDNPTVLNMPSKKIYRKPAATSCMIGGAIVLYETSAE